MQIDLDTIRRRLFENAAVRSRILRDYGVTLQPAAPEEFADAIVGQFDQATAPRPLDQDLTNDDVFRAAVKALASNSRSWATFLRSEPRLRELLSGYSPAESHEAFNRGTLRLEDVKECLPGQSSTADATAIRKWALLLTRTDLYFHGIRQLGMDFHNFGIEKLGLQIPESRLPLLLLGFLAGTITRRTPQVVRAHRERLLLNGNDLPGMGYILASEFFRNLHFGAFKPDRHVQRLFNLWCPDARAQIEPEVGKLQQLLGRRASDLGAYLGYSLIGLEASPPNVPISYTDNLVWLLGAYVERKGQESKVVYMVC